MSNTLEQAVTESKTRNRIVDVDWAGDIASCRAELDAITDGDEIDSTETNEPGVYDVWGWTSETPDGQQDWRLSVRISEARS